MAKKSKMFNKNYVLIIVLLVGIGFIINYLNSKKESFQDHQNICSELWQAISDNNCGPRPELPRPSGICLDNTGNPYCLNNKACITDNVNGIWKRRCECGEDYTGQRCEHAKRYGTMLDTAACDPRHINRRTGHGPHCLSSNMVFTPSTAVAPTAVAPTAVAPTAVAPSNICKHRGRNYCRNGGVCETQELSPGTWERRCDCYPGYMGQRCEIGQMMDEQGNYIAQGGIDSEWKSYP